MQKLVGLCADLVNAKVEETRANEKRVQIEREILAITGIPTEGTESTDAEGFRIKVEQRINRKLDMKTWTLVRDQIPEPMRPVTVVEEYKIDTKGVNWLKLNEPGYYKLLCTAMEEKPMKPSVKVEATK